MLKYHVYARRGISVCSIITKHLYLTQICSTNFCSSLWWSLTSDWSFSICCWQSFSFPSSCSHFSFSCAKFFSSFSISLCCRSKIFKMENYSYTFQCLRVWCDVTLTFETRGQSRIPLARRRRASRGHQHTILPKFSKKKKTTAWNWEKFGSWAPAAPLPIRR